MEVIFERNGLGVISCNSMDGLEIIVDVSFQYKIEFDELYNLTLLYKDFGDYAEFVESIARANIQHSCGEYTAEDFQKQRNLVANTVSDAITTDYALQVGALVSQTQLREINRPVEYDDAVRDKENALNDITLGNRMI